MQIATREEYIKFLKKGNMERAYLLEKDGNKIRVYSDIERGGEHENLRIENYDFSISEYREQLGDNFENALTEVRAWETGGIEFIERHDFELPKENDEWIIPAFLNMNTVHSAPQKRNSADYDFYIKIIIQ